MTTTKFLILCIRITPLMMNEPRVNQGLSEWTGLFILIIFKMFVHNETP